MARLHASNKERTEGVIASAQDAALSRYILEDDLVTLSAELVSSQEHGVGQPTLLEGLEDMHRKLKELQNVQQYVRVIDQALRLSSSALQEFKASTSEKQLNPSALSQYIKLQEFVAKVADLCATGVSPDPDSTIGLVSFLESVRDRTWLDIKGTLSDLLVASAEKLSWPGSIDWSAASAADRQNFISAFFKLLKLQEIGETLKAPGFNETDRNKNGIYPLQALVKPISARFKYHFEGSRETNRVDKPEWYFTHMLNAIHQHRNFMETTVQTLLNATRYKVINAHREFTRLLFPILLRKLRKSMPELLGDAALLAHTIYQSLLFDGQVKEDGFGLTGTFEALATEGKVEEWPGVSDVILGNKEWFDTWLEGERRFAEAQYDELVHSPDAWQFVDDGEQTEDEYSSQSDLRPTNSARRVKALVDQITDRYKPLPRFNHRARFLIAIQIPILEHYHTRISGSLDAFETLSSSLMRVVPGALAGQAGHQHDTRRLTTGVDGLQRLIKAFVSARWVTIAMQNWGEQLFYLELWKEINERASLRAKAAVLPSLPTPVPEHVAEDALFDELIAQYATLTARSEDLIVRHVVSEVENLLRQHIASPWSTSSEERLSLPSTLLAPVTSFQQQLAFIASTLPASSVTILYRQIASSISSYLMDKMVFQQSRGKVTPHDAAALATEYRLWIECSRQAVGKTVRKLDVPWERFRDAAALIDVSAEEFGPLTRAVRDGNSEVFQEAMERLTVSCYSQAEASHVLRLRTDSTY